MGMKPQNMARNVEATYSPVRNLRFEKRWSPTGRKSITHQDNFHINQVMLGRSLQLYWEERSHPIINMYPLVNVSKKLWKIHPCLMGKSTTVPSGNLT